MGYWPRMSRVHPRSGLSHALGAYTIWGLLPLYLMLVSVVPAPEFVAWRVLFTLPVCLLLVLARGQGLALLGTFRSPAAIRGLLLSATLIAINWLVYIYAIAQDEVYAASLGYYINPLVNITIGTIFLGERLSRRQWVAVALAGIGVAILLGGALTTLWISLSLAFTFAIYGLVRKKVPVGSLHGLTVETILLAPPAAALAWSYAASPQGSSFGADGQLSLLLALGGIITAAPLLMFGVAARRMAYSSLAFVQFLSPTIVFILGLTVFGRPPEPVQLASFVIIWCAIAVFVWDMLTRSKASGEA